MAVCGHCLSAYLWLQDDIRRLKWDLKHIRPLLRAKPTSQACSTPCNLESWVPVKSDRSRAKCSFPTVSCEPLQLNNKFQVLDNGNEPRSKVRQQLGGYSSSARASGTTRCRLGSCDQSALCLDHPCATLLNRLLTPPPGGLCSSTWSPALFRHLRTAPTNGACCQYPHGPACSGAWWPNLLLSRCLSLCTHNSAFAVVVHVSINDLKKQRCG